MKANPDKRAFELFGVVLLAVQFPVVETLNPVAHVKHVVFVVQFVHEDPHALHDGADVTNVGAQRTQTDVELAIAQFVNVPV